MARSYTSAPRQFLRDVMVATLTLAALYGLGRGVRFQPVQLPWYLLVVGFDTLEVLFGATGRNLHLLFAGYVLGLGVLAAGVATLLRNAVREPDPLGWRVAAAGALAVVGGLALRFAVLVLVGTAQLAPVFVAGAAGTVLLALAGSLAGYFRVCWLRGGRRT